MHFTLAGEASRRGARAGVLHTAHGTVPTPAFMPVGTLGGVKCIEHGPLRHGVQARIILGNTYHLFLRPGLEVLRDAGGLHGLSGWQGPLLTDSGGFQVFSLAGQRKLTEEGAYFRSHLDGSGHLFTPERVINIERIIGADIVMPLDECPPGDAAWDYTARSLELTMGWLSRCWVQMERTEPLYGYRQALFPIVQGGVYEDLRSRSAEDAMRYEAAGYAIGGLAVGEPAEEMYRILEHLDGVLPRNRPRYLMGVGTPWNLLEAIARGVDMFDCVMPTRNARNGMLFSWGGVLNIRNSKWRNDETPLGVDAMYDDSGYPQYSRRYLRHLLHSGETLGQQIATRHNLAFYQELVRHARERIVDGTFGGWWEAMARDLQRRL